MYIYLTCNLAIAANSLNSIFPFIFISIADFSKYYLFKNNTPYTRNQFLNAVRPFLRNMKNREAFEDFKVICDESNNDGQARQNNEMNAKFLLKPVYSINFIYLDFVAVGATVSFEEIEVAQN